jgi:hypothetical protein
MTLFFFTLIISRYRQLLLSRPFWGISWGSLIFEFLLTYVGFWILTCFFCAHKAETGSMKKNIVMPWRYWYRWRQVKLSMPRHMPCMAWHGPTCVLGNDALVRPSWNALESQYTNISYLIKPLKHRRNTCACVSSERLITKKWTYRTGREYNTYVFNN